MRHFMRVFLGLVPLGLVMASAVAQTAAEPPTIEYGCNDLVAVGRVKTLSFNDLSLPDDLLGHGKFSMEVFLKKILKGEESRQTVSAIQIAHSQLREDRDFIVVLSPLTEGAYILRSTYLWKSRPKPMLAERCST